jgi:hypothetical protein
MSVKPVEGSEEGKLGVVDWVHKVPDECVDPCKMVDRVKPRQVEIADYCRGVHEVPVVL